jgi:hypothetical protein
MKKIFILLIFICFTNALFASSEYNREITIVDQTRNEKVAKVFREMMNRYEEKDLDGFFSYVSEDRFLQDYMTFYEAIEKDMRIFDTINIDTWIDKITDDGVKRFLYVRWEKRYEMVSNNDEIVKRGYSRFLFDEVNGEYKLIELAGNNFWGESLREWREEVPHIAGEEVYSKKQVVQSSNDTEEDSTAVQYPDLIVIDVVCRDVDSSTSDVTFYLKNSGEGPTQSGEIAWHATNGPEEGDGTYNGDLDAGETSPQITWRNNYGCAGGSVEVDPDNLIEESDENNNKTDF